MEIPRGSMEGQLALLDELRRQQMTVAQAMLEADQRKLFPLDLLALAALNRSLLTSSGFMSLMRARNLTSANAILRLQLDTILRLHAAWIAPNPHEFSTAMLAGERVNRLRDRGGRLMRDAYLVARVSEKYPWIARVYKETSGFIHLSDKHFLGSVSDVGEHHSVTFKVSPDDSHVPERFFLETAAAFVEATRVILQYIEGWVFTKSNPEIAEQLRREAPPESD